MWFYLFNNIIQNSCASTFSFSLRCDLHSCFIDASS